MTLKELYALILAQYRGVYPVDLDVGDVRWVMDLDSYKEMRAVCQEGGAIYPEGERDPENWVPKPEDRLMGLRIEVREGGGAPHLEGVGQLRTT